MKKTVLFLLLAMVYFPIHAQTWQSLGPDSANILRMDFGESVLQQVMCADNGFYLYNMQNSIFDFYTYSGMSVTGCGFLDNQKILLTMADGSYSDGIYTFDLTTHEFEVIEWIVYPNFLHYQQASSTWWTGSDWGGLWKSEDGMVWDAVPYFDTIPCNAIASFENHITVSSFDDNSIYFSGDQGVAWDKSPFSIKICDMAFTNDGLLYGIWPGASNSTGLYKSQSFGMDWEAEFWDLFLNAFCIDAFSQIVVGYDGLGLGIYNPGNGVNFINGDLPNLNINKIQVNPAMSAPALFVSTDQGAYYSYDYFVGVDEPGNDDVIIQLSPNPTDGFVNIKSGISLTSVQIITLDGETVYNRNISAMEFQINTKEFQSGIYLLQLKSEKGISLQKLVVR